MFRYGKGGELRDMARNANIKYQTIARVVQIDRQADITNYFFLDSKALKIYISEREKLYINTVDPPLNFQY